MNTTEPDLDPVMAFYLAVDCPQCDSVNYHGLCVTTLTHRGYPVVPLDVGMATSYDCAGCGAVICVDDLDPFVDA